MQTMPAFVYLIPAVLFSGWEPFREPLPPLFCHASRSASDQPGYQASTEECCRSFALFWCDTYAIIIQGTITAGIAHYHDRYKPDNPDVALHGGHCRYDCSRRVREIVLKGITQMKIGLGFEGGIAVVILAIILDRITQGLGKQKKGK